MHTRLRLKEPVPVYLLLLASFLGAFGFLDFYSVLHVTELSILCIIVLFSWLGFSTKMDKRAVLLNLFTLCGLMSFVLVYALVFTARTGAPLLPSVLAQRYYAFILIVPVVYMLYRSGWRLKDFQRVFVLAAVLAVLSRVVVDVIPSSTTSAFSPFIDPPREFLIFKQDTVYGEASFLLRRFDASALFVTLYFGRQLLKPKNLASFGFCLAITTLSTTILFVNAPRTLLASALVALLLYSVVLSRPDRSKLFLILLPLLVLLIGMYASQLNSVVQVVFGGDLSYTTRVQSAQKAWEVISQYPLLGFGQESAQSISYHDLFGEKFYPSDIGLLGLTFQWGLVGVILYLFFSLWLVVNLLKLLWAYTGGTGKIESREQVFLWGLFVVCLTFALATPVQTRFVKTEGIAIAALSLGLVLSYKRGLRSEQRRNLQSRTQPVIDGQVERHI